MSPKGSPSHIELADTETDQPEPTEKLDKQLVARAREIIAGLKLKYAATTEKANPIQACADYAYKVWKKGALDNPRTGAMQLEGAEPVIEKYFRVKLTQK